MPNPPAMLELWTNVPRRANTVAAKTPVPRSANRITLRTMRSRNGGRLLCGTCHTSWNAYWTALRRLAERLEAIQVDNARRHGWSWQQIAVALEVSKQAVHKKHAGRPGAEEE